MELLKYPKIREIGHEDNQHIFENPTHNIVIQEKIDGANFRFIYHKGNLIFGSRTQQLTSNNGEDTNINKNFMRCINHIRKNINTEKLKKMPNLIYYGECCVKHSINYQWDKIPPYLGFDIYDTQEGKFIPYPQVEEIFVNINLHFVPVIEHTTVQQFTKQPINDQLIPKSNSKKTKKGAEHAEKNKHSKKKQRNKENQKTTTFRPRTKTLPTMQNGNKQPRQSMPTMQTTNKKMVTTQ